MTRTEAIKILKSAKTDKYFGTSEQLIEAWDMAINSLEVDEAYQLEYEHIPDITLDELKEIRDEIFKDLIQHSGTGEEVIQAYCDGLNKSLAILDKKISELEKTE